MRCPYCFSEETKVVDKRNSPDADATRRRRECLTCSKRFTTYERVEELDITVLKRDGSKESFSRDKVVTGIRKACMKRPVSEEQMEKIADEIESEVRKSRNSEIESREIGALVMGKLKVMDEVAYLRFASICKSFKNAKSFEKELAVLHKSKAEGE